MSGHTTAVLPIGLSLAASALWGTADFTGGLASRKTAAFFVVALAHGLSLLAVLSIALATHAALPNGHAFRFGLLAGTAGGIGLIFFFTALGSGKMGLTASLSGVITAAVPVVYSLVAQQPPSPIQLCGFVVAALAIWLIASGPRTAFDRRSLLVAVLSGIAFGSMLVLLRLADGGALWPLVASRTASTGVAILFSLGVVLLRPKSSGEEFRFTPTLLALCAISGLLDAGGNYLYTTAALMGRLDIAGVLSSLYPGVTILLAAWLLKEHASRLQAMGMALALGAVVMISI